MPDGFQSGDGANQSLRLFPTAEAIARWHPSPGLVDPASAWLLREIKALARAVVDGRIDDDFTLPRAELAQQIRRVLDEGGPRVGSCLKTTDHQPAHRANRHRALEEYVALRYLSDPDVLGLRLSPVQFARERRSRGETVSSFEDAAARIIPWRSYLTMLILDHGDEKSSSG